MLLPGQSLRGRLPLLSPRLYTFQPSPPGTSTSARRERPSRVKLWARVFPDKFSRNCDFHATLGSFTCRKVLHWTDGFTSPPKEGVLRIFCSIFLELVTVIQPQGVTVQVTAISISLSVTYHCYEAKGVLEAMSY